MSFPPNFNHYAHLRLAQNMYEQPSGVTINRPAHFPGSPEEISKNRETHVFGEEGRCMSCDCRAYGIVSEWPCGSNPPRVTVTMK